MQGGPIRIAAAYAETIAINKQTYLKKCTCRELHDGYAPQEQLYNVVHAQPAHRISTQQKRSSELSRLESLWKDLTSVVIAYIEFHPVSMNTLPLSA